MARKDITDLQVCRAAAAFWADYHAGKDSKLSTADRLMAQTGQAEKVCYSAVQRAIQHGFLEHGVSLRTAYLTAAGNALLAANPTPKA